MDAQLGDPPLLEWGWAGHALDVLSGDVHVVAGFSGGALVALLDGLGHGVEAAAASTTAASLLKDHAFEPVASLVQRCHEALRKTRGVVMSLASFDYRASTMTWTGIGNVETLLLRVESTGGRSRETIYARGGVVGYQLPPLRCDTLPVVPGDTLIMATDGIQSGFSTDMLVHHSPQTIAEAIVARFAKDSDDAHVVVARYIGASP